MRILVFTDSRGQHKAQGSTHKLYGEMLGDLPGLKVDPYYCPFKWTTTLDFLDSFNRNKLAKYDLVVLHTGIVDFSPRPFSNAFGDLYDNQNLENIDNLSLNTRDYLRKIRNWKKPIFDKIFGEETMAEHFQSPFDSFYNGERTINLYGFEMARLRLIPILNRISNLLFVNTNRIVPGWNGDFPRERPRNMDVIHNYCQLLSEDIENQIDLSKWTDEEIKRFTTDNLHLTEEGNTRIFNEILDSIDRKEDKVEEKPVTISIPSFWNISKNVEPFTAPELITKEKREKILESYGLNECPIASLVIGFRLKEDEPCRLDNMMTLLDWIDKYFPDLFEVILLEQDSQEKFDCNLLKHGERYHFIYNPESYNRGWAYNVAAKHFVTTPVIAACDTDVLLGKTFLQSILQCHRGKEFISPYRNVYYSSGEEAEAIRKNLSYSGLKFDESKLKNPVSITGGIFIANTQAYLRLAGFEQYMGYACEDRAFDAAISELANPETVLVQNETYVHLSHQLDHKEKKNFSVIYKHLVENYGCKYYSELDYKSYIHQYCRHQNSAKMAELVQFRRQSDDWGDPWLYNKKGLGINGITVSTDILDTRKHVKAATVGTFPDEFTNLDEYKAKEIYSDNHEPSEGLQHFYNKYKGERCVIIGNGPSLNKLDLGKIQNEYTFGVNSLYYKTRECGFKPTFFVVEDSSVMKENLSEIKKYNTPYKFFPTIYKALHGEARNVFFFKMNRGFYEKSSPNYCVPRFSTDISKIAYCGQSVTHINLQLAYFMGFTEVYLVGMDFSYVIPESHSRKGDVLVSDTDDTNHFHKDYFGKGKSWKDPKLDRVLMNYKQAKLAYESAGRKIYNATKGGKLEIFDRVDYDSVFRYKLPEIYRTNLAEEKDDIKLEQESSFMSSEENLIYLPGNGLISLSSQFLRFGLPRKIKEVRVKSLNTNEVLSNLEVDIESQETEMNRLFDTRGNGDVLLEAMPEGADWVSLGTLRNRKKWLFGSPSFEISGGYKCTRFKEVGGEVSAAFSRGRKRIMLELFVNNRSLEEEGNGHTLISPVELGKFQVIGYKNV